MNEWMVRTMSPAPTLLLLNAWKIADMAAHQRRSVAMPLASWKDFATKNPTCHVRSNHSIYVCVCVCVCMCQYFRCITHTTRCAGNLWPVAANEQSDQLFWQIALPPVYYWITSTTSMPLRRCTRTSAWWRRLWPKCNAFN